MLPYILGIGGILGMLALMHSKGKGATPVFSHGVESWRQLIVIYGADLRIPCVLEWIAEESGGNPCAIGELPPVGATYPKEYGLAQLYGGSNDKIATAGQLRDGMCAIGGRTRKSWEVQLRSLTTSEKLMHINAALELIRLCRTTVRAWLKKASAPWKEDNGDFWNMIKLWHASPAMVKLLPNVTKSLGHSPRNWHEYKTVADAIAVKNGFSRAYLDKVWHNCERVGNAY